MSDIIETVLFSALVLVAGMIVSFGLSGCATQQAPPITINAFGDVCFIQAGNSSSVSRPVEVSPQANGNSLSYTGAAGALGAGAGMFAGNPLAGALIGAGGGYAIYQIVKPAAKEPTP